MTLEAFRACETPNVRPYVVAFCLVSDKRAELMREQGRISSPECRQLKRVLDYLDIRCDIEAMNWPETIDA